ncbi:kynureninase [Aspergillus saccharolyticus JOP 1030-1]|uniref:Kynureninase n=1 Tax=Aspergillus saccharolyticus JOP 1030-1 TaxID=1450539 RepID=A0A318ZLD7_9EURO|nr:kynureninase [Aspergillus saccharolyticus JOP 1030-1]PYH47565.1 kynureninase [Aspergillus saccharolyticus JOP 1030-1]
MLSDLHTKRADSASPLSDLTRDYAQSLDAQDPLRHFRQEFLIPSKKDLKRKTLAAPDENDEEDDQRSIYLCGNSLGVQPRNVRKYIDHYLRAWALKGVTGHFVPHDDQLLPPFVSVDEAGSKLMAPIVGAKPEEVAVMGTLTANLHLLMASFYKPTQERYKIIIEGKAFPSDHYAVESQIVHHGLRPEDAMVLIEPRESQLPILTTEQILRVIDEHASSTAVILLSAIQFYTGQYFEIEKITSYAQSKGILVGWDCAHAAGNVDLQLHDWNVDFAAWCTYKYLNSGPGCMAALFVHEKHGKVEKDKIGTAEQAFRPRLSGWWGGDKQRRFLMENKFVPQTGAAGYQLSNPSVLDTSALAASLELFNRTSMAQLREKSLKITAYLERLLKYPPESLPKRTFSIITPSNPAERGAQLSLRLAPGLLDSVLEVLEEHGVVIDERKPDVIRVAPAPMYNSYVDVWEFCQVFFKACRLALDTRK